VGGNHQFAGSCSDFSKKNEVEFAFDISFNPIFAGKIRSILSDAKKLFHPRWERPTLLSKKKHAG
jgi:hypothetical protein